MILVLGHRRNGKYTIRKKKKTFKGFLAKLPVLTSRFHDFHVSMDSVLHYYFAKTGN